MARQIHIHIHRKAKDAAEYPSLYKTAEEKNSGNIYRVLKQDALKKEDVRHLLLDIKGSRQWRPLEALKPVL